MLLKNKKLKTVLLALCITMLCSGCRKLIEIPPPQSTIDNIGEFANDAQAKTAMAGLYASMVGGFMNGGSTIAGGLSADEIISNMDPSVSTDYQLERNRLLANNDRVSGIWSSLYNNIYITNAVLENVPISTNLSDTLKNELTGEAEFARAFTYFYLTNYFGDVPLVLSTDFNKTAKLPRSAQADVYKQIVSDLLDAQSRLPAGYEVSSGNRTIPNKLAATAMLARVYLYQKDWKDAELQASLLINNSLLSLNNTLGNVFLKGSTETIWQFEISTKNPVIGDLSSFRPNIVYSDYTPDLQAYFQSDWVDFSAYMIPIYTLRPEVAAAFESGDQREAAWVAYAQAPMDAPYNGVITYFPYKYKELLAPGTVPSEGYVILRLAEQYLIRAEARAEQGELANAAADINVIRNRAGLGNTTAATQSELLDADMQERRIEFFAEWGHRWMDLKRTGKALPALSLISEKTPVSSNALLYPIPLSEINNDAFLIQNPGY